MNLRELTTREAISDALHNLAGCFDTGKFYPEDAPEALRALADEIESDMRAAASQREPP